jgi:hypothetical protein
MAKIIEFYVPTRFQTKPTPRSHTQGGKVMVFCATGEARLSGCTRPGNGLLFRGGTSARAMDGIWSNTQTRTTTFRAQEPEFDFRTVFF